MTDNFCDTLNHWAEATPYADAVIQNNRHHNYRDFRRYILTMRHALASQDLGKGSIAVILIFDLLDAWIVNFSLRILGFNTVTVISVAKFVRLALKDVACIVATRGEIHRYDQDLINKLDLPFIIIPSWQDIEPDGRSNEALIAQQPLGGNILYTSGTTGTHKNIFLDAAFERERNELRRRHFFLEQSTLHHGWNFHLWTGIGFKHASAVWHVGGTIIFDQSDHVADTFFDLPITSACLIEADLRHILSKRGDKAPPKRAWNMTYGGGFLPHDLAQRAVSELNARPFVTYGCTETSGLLMGAVYTTLDDLMWYKVSQDRNIDVVDPSGHSVTPHVEGELRVQLKPSDAHGYMDDSEINARFFRNSYFYPGDLAVRRADGRIRVLGRAGEVINLQGQKLAAAPYEIAFQQALAVDEVCIFTGMNDTWHDEIAIVIQGDRLPSADKVRATAMALGLAGNFRVHLMRAFPRSENGMKKTLRAELRRLVFTPNKSQS